MFFHTLPKLEQQLFGLSDEIIVDYVDLYNYDVDYALDLLEDPLQYLTKLDHASGKNVIIRNLLTDTPLHELNSSKLYKLIQVKGVVIQVNKPSRRPSVICFECPSCHETLMIEQTNQWRQSPEKCNNCDNRRDFKKIFHKSEFEDYQWITIQQSSEETLSGKTPVTLKVLLKNHLTDICTVGEDVIIVGVMKVQEEKPNQAKLELKNHLEAHSFMKQDFNMDIDLSLEEKERIRGLMNQPDHLEKVIQSFAPTIYGCDHVKEAFAYQQCEGMVRTIDKKRKRGQFHIFLTGPPGLGKSELCEYQAYYHPKGRISTGKGASGVGLTASVVKDGDEWVLKGGAMVLADNGLLFVDEIEKMSKEDSGSMHPAMEAQEVPINKAGINASLKTRCSVVAACNPLDGVWNDYKTLTQNLHEGNRGIPIPLLDRFALIYVIKKNVSWEEEKPVAEHIANINMDKQCVDVPYDADTLRYIFAYARTIEVEIPKEIGKMIVDFYEVMFKASVKEQTEIFSRRNIQDEFRLVEASTRLHGRNIAIVDDFNNAKRVIIRSIQEYATDPYTGKIDQNIISVGVAQSEAEIRSMLPSIIDELSVENEDGSWADEDEVVQYLVDYYKLDEEKARVVIGHAEKSRIIYYRGLKTNKQLKRS